jgi:hemolysin III
MTSALRTEAPAATRLKPRLRGVFHEIGFYVSLGLAVPLVWLADPGRPRLAALIFASCVAICFGASALYHRPTWSPRARGLLARLDHAGIYLLIAGTYTPVALLVLSGWTAKVLLAVVWAGAGAATVVKLCWLRSPKWLSAVFGLTLGWIGAVAVLQLPKLGAARATLLVVGGVLYSAGAFVYARRRPDPVPQLFGYHELFHVLTLAGAAAHYAAIALVVLPDS